MPAIDVKFTKEDITKICQGLNIDIDQDKLLEKINTNGALETATDYGMMIDSYHYHMLGGRIGYRALLIDIGTSTTAYLERVRKMLRPEVYKYLVNNIAHFESIVDIYDNKLSMELDYLQFLSHYTSYFTRDSFDGRVVETVAQMHLRVTGETFYRDTEGLDEYGEPVSPHNNIGEACNFLTSSLEFYFSFASPVFFNSGFKEHNMSSCFLMRMADTLNSIMENVKRIAIVSKVKGGVGLDISDLRHSNISHYGMSRGVTPVMRIVDSVIQYVDQGGKRSGACTAFLQVHHKDILSFITMTKKNTDLDKSVQSLNTAVVFPNLFWKRLQENGNWTVFCPHKFPGLNETFGKEYEELYLKYETMPLTKDMEPYRTTMKAETIVSAMAEVQILSGMPYVIHKDNINYKSNRVNMDSHNPVHRQIITSSNLCLEIFEQSSDDEVACCNLGQMSLPRFIRTGQDGLPFFDFHFFAYMVRQVTGYLDRIIDNSNYPLPEAKTSNMAHRPIGLGVSGYGDILNMLGIPYESKEAEILNKKIFACMYFNSLVESLSLAIKVGAPYSTFDGSPLSNGKFQFDLWKEESEMMRPFVGDERNPEDDEPIDPKEWGQPSVIVGFKGTSTEIVVLPSWDDLRSHIISYGVRNCQRIALMPTASTSRLMANTECIEAHQEGIYVREFMSHSIKVINRHLQRGLEDLGLWSKDVAEFIVADHGSVQRLPQFLNNNSPELKKFCELYKTMFEIKQKNVFKQTSQRHRYVDQGISANIYLAKPTIAMLKNFHLYTWKLGLNTGMYYLRSTPASDPDNFTISSKAVRDFIKKNPSLAASMIKYKPALPSVKVEEVDEKKEDIEVVPSSSTTAGAFCKRDSATGCVSCSL